MRRFELEEGTSSKFWEVEAEGAELTVRFGRIGTQGQTRTRTLADAAAATRERDKLIKEKTGKGYSEVTVAADAKLAAVAPTAPKAAAAPQAPPPGAAPAATTANPTSTANATVLKHATAGAAATGIATANAAASRSAESPPTGISATAAAAGTSAPAPEVKWPTGGFQWTDEWRGMVPIVRGIRVPPLQMSDVPETFVFAEDKYGFQAKSFNDMAQAAGKPWASWGPEGSKEHITCENLRRADPDFWLELYAQCLYGNEPRAIRWITLLGCKLHGPAFVLSVTLEFWSLQGVRGYLHPHTFTALRHAIAAAAEDGYRKALAVAESGRARSEILQLICSHVFPHLTEWAVECAQQSQDPSGFLQECVLPAQSALEYFRSRSNVYFGYSKGALLLQVHLHDAAAFDLLLHVLGKMQGKDQIEEMLELVTAMHIPQMVHALADGIEQKEVRAALDKLAKQYPAAALVAVIEHALASHARSGQGWAVRLGLTHPEALASALAALSAADRVKFEAVLAALDREDAPAEELPELLRNPPWLRKEKARELPTFGQSPLSSPERIEWDEGERQEHLGFRANQYYLRDLPTDPQLRNRHVLTKFAVKESAHASVLAGNGVTRDDLARDEGYTYRTLEMLCLLPESAMPGFWNTYPQDRWYTYGSGPIIRFLLARYGTAALPGFINYVSRDPVDGLELAEKVDSPEIARLALHGLRNLKKARIHAIAWIKAHPRTTIVTALAQAFTADKTLRDNAQYGVRWLAQNGFADQLRAGAQEYGGQMPDALEALLAADPLLVLPSRIPRLPAFFVSASFSRPVLKSGGALPLAAMEHVGTMLAISKLDEPYAGVAVVKEVCTPESLAAFGWDVFEAWIGAGAPSKEGWAFSALGLIGNDETARRLAPKIREWPGESAHQRAVTGLDLLAAIGSDTALMHLNGIASKVKFKALQDRAREKIQAVAEARGFTAEELADRLTPDLGLDTDGSLKLDFGPRQFLVAFDETLKPFVKDLQGTRLKDLPKPIKSDDAALAEAATERYKQMKKDAKAIASLQVTRLELAMVARRRWSEADFRAFFLEHPLLRHLTSRLVWGVYDDGEMRDGFRVAEDWTLADRSDALCELPAGATVGIAHVLEMPQEMQAAFGQVFADYEILQPFKQLGRETYTGTAQELASASITRFADKTVSTGSVMGLMNRGWERGQAQDAGWVGWFTRRLGEFEIELRLDPGTVVGDPSFEPRQKLPEIVLSKRNAKAGSSTFAQLDPILLSEVLRDIDMLAPVAEG